MSELLLNRDTESAWRTSSYETLRARCEGAGIIPGTSREDIDAELRNRIRQVADECRVLPLVVRGTESQIDLTIPRQLVVWIDRRIGVAQISRPNVSIVDAGSGIPFRTRHKCVFYAAGYLGLGRALQRGSIRTA